MYRVEISARYFPKIGWSIEDTKQGVIIAEVYRHHDACIIVDALNAQQEQTNIVANILEGREHD